MYVRTYVCTYAIIINLSFANVGGNEYIEQYLCTYLFSVILNFMINLFCYTTSALSFIMLYD